MSQKSDSCDQVLILDPKSTPSEWGEQNYKIGWSCVFIIKYLLKMLQWIFIGKLSTSERRIMLELGINSVSLSHGWLWNKFIQSIEQSNKAMESSKLKW